LRALPHCASTTCLTCFGSTHLHDRTTRLFGAEVLVEGDHAMHFGNGDVEHFGKKWSEFWVDPPGRVLNGVEGRQQPTLDVLETAHDGVQFGAGGRRAQGLQA